MSRKIRCLAAVLALALLSAGAAQARPLQSHSASPGFLDILWQWLAGHSVPSLTAIWEKEGRQHGPQRPQLGHPGWTTRRFREPALFFPWRVPNSARAMTQ